MRICEAERERVRGILNFINLRTRGEKQKQGKTKTESERGEKEEIKGKKDR